MPKNPKRADGAKLLKRAGKAAQEVAREAQRHVPPDLIKQLERNATEVQKGVQQMVKQVQSQLNRAASKSDFDRLIKRIDDLVARVAALEKAGGRAARGAAASAAGRRSASSRSRSTSSSSPRSPRRTRRAGSSETPPASS